jgi:hypothetical protein
MFIRYFVTIGLPSDEVEAAFKTGVELWMPALVQKVNTQGMQLLSELGFDVGKRRIERQIEVKVGMPKPIVGATLVPIHWQAASTSWLFPELDGQLEIAALGSATTQLGISATYDPPLGLVGKIADRALLHRVAEVTIRDFLEGVSNRLEPR